MEHIELTMYKKKYFRLNRPDSERELREAWKLLEYLSQKD